MRFGRPFRAVSLCVPLPGPKPWAVLCPPFGRLEQARENVQTPWAADAAWMERLWSDCTFVPDADSNGCIFRTQESSWGENFCVSELRRHMLKMELAFRPKQLWDESRKHQ